jgi:hemerythrin-like domain-containing protein
MAASTTGDRDRAQALSLELRAIHDSLRDRLRMAVDALAHGRAPDTDLRPLDHCIGFCVALHEHHTGEDTAVFPALRAAAPELSDTIDKLTQDHSMMSWLLRRAATAIELAAASGDVAPVVAELEGISAIMESHFRYEERSILEGLDRLPGPTPLAEAMRPADQRARRV